MAAPTKFNPDIHMDWAWSLAIRGATDQDIADAFHVSERTINRWKYETDASGKPITDENGEKVLSEFGKLLACAKEAADAKVEKCLFQRCTGFDHTEEERILEYNPDGSVKPVKVRTVKKSVPPDVMAIMYWLNNRKRKTGEWSQKQDITLRTETEVDLSDMSEEDLRNLAALARPETE